MPLINSNFVLLINKNIYSKQGENLINVYITRRRTQDASRKSKEKLGVFSKVPVRNSQDLSLSLFTRCCRTMHRYL